MKKCLCCSNLSFQACCEPYLEGQAIDATPEQLMRSRFTAYALQNFDYLLATMKGSALKNFDIEHAKKQAQDIIWEKLEIIDAPLVTDQAEEGFVEFKAFFLQNGSAGILHERSRFVKRKGRWYYIDGKLK